MRYDGLMSRVLPAAALLVLTGCVDRVMTIRSEPPGAEVFLDGEPIGRIPMDGGGLDIPYVWYGTREIVLTQRGYLSHSRKIELNAPWWQVFPFDFITDVLLPVRLRDRTTVDVTLLPDTTDRAEVAEVLKRAKAMQVNCEIATARDSISSLRKAIVLSEEVNGKYPSKLLDLLGRPPPAGARLNESHVWIRTLEAEELPTDPWGNDFMYRFPGDRSKDGFDLFSNGPDGKAGTEDDVY